MFKALTSRFSGGESTVEQREVFERRVRGRRVEVQVESIVGEVEESDEELVDLWLDSYVDDLFWVIIFQETGALSSSMDFGGANVCIEARRVK